MGLPAISNLHLTDFTVFIKRGLGLKIQSDIGQGKWITLAVNATDVAGALSEKARPVGTLSDSSNHHQHLELVVHLNNIAIP